MACSNVTSDFCTAPANLEPPITPRSKCVLCDDKVCKACSAVEPRTGPDGQTKKVRVCDNCLSYEADGQAKVRLRHYHQAGYTTMTLDKVKAELVAQGLT